jgi:PEP-CTERM motif
MKRIIGLAVLAVFSSNASASLIGDTVTLDWLANGVPCLLCSTVNVVVEAGPGDTASPNPTVLDVNVEASSILIDILTTGVGAFDFPTDFNGLVVSSLDWVGDPTKTIVDVVLGTDIAGLGSDRISFGDHSVSVNFASLSVATGQFITLDLVTTQVPEPGLLSLLSIGLLGLGFLRRKPAA